MIVIEKFQSIGPWGMSHGQRSLLERQVYTNSKYELPWSVSADSLEKQILSRKLDGKISRELTGENIKKSGLIQTGPLETRFANRLMETALSIFEKTSLSRTDRNDLNLVCAVESQASITGYRNGLRLGYDFKQNFNESQFVKRLDQIFMDIHPMMSLHNMPNQMAGNLAINFDLGGEVINVAGRNSSFEALKSAIRLVKAHKSKKALLVGGFCYRPSIISNLLPLIMASSLSHTKGMIPSLNEWVGVSCIRKSNKPRPGNMAIRFISSSIFDSIGNLHGALLNSIRTLTRKARVDLKEIDLVLVNDASTGWFTDEVLNIQSYNHRLQFVDSFHRLGYSSHCSFLQSLELAQMIFDTGTIPGNLRKGYRDSMFFSGIQQQRDFFNGKFILVIGLGFPNQIQMTLLNGVVSK